jgi:hypoxanthine phosphoribosyltransferase
MVKSSAPKPDLLLGLTRGGLIPAVMLSHMTGIPMIAAQYSSKDGAGDNKNHRNRLPNIDAEHIMIVDDIADSGYTLQEVSDHYTKQGHVVSTSVLYYKEGSVFSPTFHAAAIEADSPFIYFPWEMEEPEWARGGS